MSVAKITDAGDDVRLSKAFPHIRNTKTGQITKLRKEGNLFVMDLWVQI
jgi:hypothetical protein